MEKKKVSEQFIDAHATDQYLPFCEIQQNSGALNHKALVGSGERNSPIAVFKSWEPQN